MTALGEPGRAAPRGLPSGREGWHLLGITSQAMASWPDDPNAARVAGVRDRYLDRAGKAHPAVTGVTLPHKNNTDRNIFMDSV